MRPKRISARIPTIVALLSKGLITAVVICAVALALAWQLQPGDRLAWRLELMRYAPYPVYLLPAMAALAASVMLNWRWRLAALLGVALVLSLVMGLAVGQGDTGTGRFRLLTYNVKSHGARGRPEGYARLALEVLQHRPDILLMQDANGIDDAPERLTPDVRALLGDRQVFHHGQFVVASRFPLRDCRPGKMAPLELPQPFYVRCTVVMPDGEVDLVTAHLVSPRQGLNAARNEWWDGIDEWKRNFAIRLLQARHLANELVTDRAAGLAMDSPAKPRPLIVAGDLNALESSPVVRSLLDIGLRDAFRHAGFGYGHTHGHSLRLGFSFLRIDHILVGPTLGVGHSFVGGSEASEHRPVIADLILQRQ